jgi:NADP-dependent 3-hydroxy acid dehydrogenase YdfG
MITGTSSGLGRALAEQALAAGNQVAAAARDPHAVQDLEETHPGTAAAIRLDVTDQASVGIAVTAAECRFGSIDVLVNNAGYGYTAAIEEGEDDAVADLLATKILGRSG